MSFYLFIAILCAKISSVHRALGRHIATTASCHTSVKLSKHYTLALVKILKVISKGSSKQSKRHTKLVLVKVIFVDTLFHSNMQLKESLQTSLTISLIRQLIFIWLKKNTRKFGFSLSPYNLLHFKAPVESLTRKSSTIIFYVIPSLDS